MPDINVGCLHHFSLMSNMTADKSTISFIHFFIFVTLGFPHIFIKLFYQELVDSIKILSFITT